MIKAVFIDNPGPYEAKAGIYRKGKAYWLRPDQFERWKKRGRVEAAPADMPAENSPYMVVGAGRGVYDVVGPDNVRLNEEPLSLADAQRLLEEAGDTGDEHDPGAVEIPPGWQDFLADPTKELAAAILGPGSTVATKKAAVKIIEQELKRRDESDA